MLCWMVASAKVAGHQPSSVELSVLVTTVAEYKTHIKTEVLVVFLRLLLPVWHYGRQPLRRSQSVV